LLDGLNPCHARRDGPAKDFAIMSHVCPMYLRVGRTRLGIAGASCRLPPKSGVGPKDRSCMEAASELDGKHPAEDVLCRDNG
jgi:hypothetical protein